MKRKINSRELCFFMAGIIIVMSILLFKNEFSATPVNAATSDNLASGATFGGVDGNFSKWYGKMVNVSYFDPRGLSGLGSIEYRTGRLVGVFANDNHMSDNTKDGHYSDKYNFSVLLESEDGKYMSPVQYVTNIEKI